MTQLDLFASEEDLEAYQLAKKLEDLSKYLYSKYVFNTEDLQDRIKANLLKEEIITGLSNLKI